MRLWAGIAVAAVVVLAVLSSVVAAAAADGARGVPGEVPRVEAGAGERPAQASAARARQTPGAGAFVPARGGEVLPVLPFGTGLACLGLGIGVLGLRLRRG